MKHIIKILFASIIFYFFACSEDYLVRPPLGVTTEGLFPINETDALLATNGAYNILRKWEINSGGFPILDIMADQTTKGTDDGGGVATAAFENFTFDASQPSIESWYATLYQGIRKTNLVILELPKINMDEALKNRYIAEASFIRAYFYSILVRAFGDIVMVLEINPSLELSRTDAQVVWNEIIIPDLEFAISVLPEKSEYPAADLGRVTKGGAKALLARLYLYLGDFVAVQKLAEEVINSGQYSLQPNFEDAFNVENEGGIESVWEVPALPFGSFGSGGNQYGNTWAVRGTPNRGWGFGRPAYPWILKMQDNNDPRLDASVIFLGEVIDGFEISGDDATTDTTRVDGQIVEIECYNQKIWTPGATTEESYGHNQRIIRYADVLLMAAEAANENGNSTVALNYLNQIRERARGGSVGIVPDITTVDQSALRIAIENERNYELAFEGLRYWDLVRTNRAKDVLGPLGFVEDKHELFPIPQSEIDISQRRITQNPNYQ